MLSGLSQNTGRTPVSAVHGAGAGGPSIFMGAFTTRLLVLYAALFAVCLGLILELTGNRFSYSLDDAYIHLALAQNIARGHYGMNAGEAASPASSIAWPFLLAPLSRLGIGAWLPLLYNAALSLAACLLMGSFFKRWYLRFHPESGFSAGERILLWPLAFFFIVAANLIGLTYLGMEHVLQIVLVLGCALAILEAYAGERIPAAYLVMAALAPSVRYEDLAFTLGVSMACWFAGRRAAGAAVFAAGCLPLAAFSFFLHARGLAWLPNSVLVKGGVAGQQGGHFHHAFVLIATNLADFVKHPDHWPMLALAAALGALAYAARGSRRHLKMLLCALVPVLLMMSVGPYGWFYRYDVCCRFFAFLIVFAVLAQRPGFRLLSANAVALVAASFYLIALVKTPYSALQTSLQQREMARFAHRFYHGNFAVNDLGWVCFNKDDHQYVLDLWGLASSEAMVPVKDAAWLRAIADKHHVGLVMIYPDWYQGIPGSWTPVGVLHMRSSRLYRTANNAAVTFYATHSEDAPEIRREIAAFRAELPPGAWITEPQAGSSGS